MSLYRRENDALKASSHNDRIKKSLKSLVIPGLHKPAKIRFAPRLQKLQSTTFANLQLVGLLFISNDTFYRIRPHGVKGKCLRNTPASKELYTRVKPPFSLASYTTHSAQSFGYSYIIGGRLARGLGEDYVLTVPRKLIFSNRLLYTST